MNDLKNTAILKSQDANTLKEQQKQNVQSSIIEEKGDKTEEMNIDVESTHDFDNNEALSNLNTKRTFTTTSAQRHRDLRVNYKSFDYVDENSCDNLSRYSDSDSEMNELCDKVNAIEEAKTKRKVDKKFKISIGVIEICATAL